MAPFLIAATLAFLSLGVTAILAYRYVLRAIDEGRPGWGNPRARGVYCPHAKGELGAPGVPGKDDPA